MNKEQKSRVRLLVDALRSGEYKQTTGALRNEDGHCCLGVACDIAAKHDVDQWTTEPDIDGAYWISGPQDLSKGKLSKAVAEWFGFDSANPELGGATATHLNDKEGMTFEQIANRFEERYLKEGSER